MMASNARDTRAEPPEEIATAVAQPVEASGEATEEMREAKKAAGELIDGWRGAYRRYGDNHYVITTIR